VFTRLDGGRGLNLLPSGPPRDLAAAGYVEEEWAACGTAMSYVAVGELVSDGFWHVEPDAAADFTTRVVVRRPVDPARFNGSVVVEWFNVTSGLDVAANWSFTGDEVLRCGYAYVGVSAQSMSVEGGDAAIPIALMGTPVGLRGMDPERYGGLHHPGDQFSYDLFTQIARGLRASAAAPLGGLTPRRLLAVGESQSAFRLVTYINAVHPLAGAFDGFFVHSRGRSAAGLHAGALPADALTGDPVRIRTDLATPVLVVQTEGDLLWRLDFLPARQDDTDHVRTWEIAGCAHADRYSVGDAADLLGCPAPINEGPAHYVLKSALRHLDQWVAGEGPPPTAPRIELDGSGDILRDACGNAVGGIRTPPLDVAVATLSGEPVGDVVICQLFGSTTRFPRERLREIHGDRATYLARFDAALDDAVAAGWVLEDDRPAMAAEARAVTF
jgi:hypothetical protein